MKGLRVPKCLIYIAATFIAAIAVQGCSSASSVPATPSEHEPQSISRAVFAEGQLWLLGDNGALEALQPEQAKPEPVMAASKVLDICNSRGRLVAVVQHGRNHWIIQQRFSDGWTGQATVPIAGDTLIAVDCKPDTTSITLLTSRRLLEVNEKSVETVPLDHGFQSPAGTGIALAAGDTVWVGFNAGEWGGGLGRISRKDGRVEAIESNRSGELCGGPLNAGCDPVTGIVVAPWDSSCVVAAVGLVHMLPHGRIVQICGRSVKRLYFKPFEPQPPRQTLDDGEPPSTVAFYGLSRVGNVVWAVGIDGLYRFDGKQPAQFQPLPKFVNKGGYWVSFGIPGIVLVMTDINQRMSLSGSVPIMAVR